MSLSGDPKAPGDSTMSALQDTAKIFKHMTLHEVDVYGSSERSRQMKF